MNKSVENQAWNELNQNVLNIALKHTTNYKENMMKKKIQALIKEQEQAEENYLKFFDGDLRQKFMDIFRRDDFHSIITPDDADEVFRTIMHGSSDFSVELFNEILNDYSSDLEVEAKIIAGEHGYDRMVHPELRQKAKIQLESRQRLMKEAMVYYQKSMRRINAKIESLYTLLRLESDHYMNVQEEEIKCRVHIDRIKAEEEL